MQLLRLANEDQTVIIDLLRAPFGLRAGWDTQTPLMGGSYTYEPYGAQFAFGNYQPTSESFELVIEGRCVAVRAAMDSLQDFLESIRLFHSGDLPAKSCWLEWQANGDEHPKRTLLYSGIFRVTSEENVTPSMVNGIIVGRLTLSRHPLWESVVSKGWSLAGQQFTTIGYNAPIADIVGNAPARIEYFMISSIDAGIGLDNHWVGIRRFNQGTANFEPVWECEDGIAGTDCGAAVLDATASPEQVGAGTGARRRVTYVDITLQPRLNITVAAVCAAHGHTDYDHQQGRYLVLLRCKLSAAGTNGIQMRSGYTGNIIGEEVYIDNTVWRFIPLGNISIPPWEGDWYSDDMFMYNFRIDIYAEQLTAGANLDLDCLVLIPNEYQLTLASCNTQADIQDFAITNEDDTEVAYEYNLAGLRISDAIEGGMIDWYLPNGDNVFVYAGEDIATPDVMDTVFFEMVYYPRWLLYRTD